MNRILFITFVAISVLFTSEVKAQEGKDNKHFDREVFQAKRNAYITAEVGLTPEEAAVFIPLLDEMKQKMFELGHECRKFTREVRSKRKITDEEYLKNIDECLEVKVKEALLEKEYYEKFKKILSPEKLYKYRRAEYKFAREFMKDRKEEKNNKKK